MDFNFQKPKPPGRFEFEFGPSRSKNISDDMGEVPSNEFNLRKSNRPSLCGPTNFSVLPNFSSADDSSQFPRFMTGETSPRSLNEVEVSFSRAAMGTGKEIDIDLFQRRAESRDGRFFDSQSGLADPQSIAHSRSEVVVSPEYMEPHLSYQRKSKDSERVPEALQRHKQQVLTKSHGPPGGTDVQNVEINKEVTKNSSSSKHPQSDSQSSVPGKSLSFTGFNSELEEFSITYTKLLSDKMELEMQKQRLEDSVKECRENYLNMQNMYEDMKEKFQEELKNRESVDSRMVYLNSVSEAVQRHCKDISGTLQMYKDINEEHSQRHNKTIIQLDKLKQDYEETFQSQKLSIQILQKEAEESEKTIGKKSEELRKMDENIKLLEEESRVKLVAEQARYSTLEQELTSSQVLINELQLQLEALEKTSSEKYSCLQEAQTKLQARYQEMEKENHNLRLYISKCGELEEHILKLENEKEELSTKLGVAQQNLLKSEEECTVLNDLKGQLCLELEKANDIIFKLGEDLSSSKNSLAQEKLVVEKLQLDIEGQKQEIQSKSEEIEVWTDKFSRLEDRLRTDTEEIEDKENIILELKKQICDLIQELSDMKEEISKNEDEKCTYKKKNTDLELQFEQLQTKEKELMSEVAEKDQVIAKKENEILNMKLELEKAIQDKNHSEQELKKSSLEVERCRQEMMFSLDQYREQYMADLKDNEDKFKNHQQKYDSLCSEKEKLVGEKEKLMVQLKDSEISIEEYKKNMNGFQKTMDMLKKDHEKELKSFQKKMNDRNEQLLELKKTVSRLEEEQKTLQSSNKDLKEKLNEYDYLKEEKETLEKQIELMQKEINEFRAKKVSLPSLPVTSTPKEVRKSQEDAPTPKKRVCFDDDFSSDASSIELSNFLTQGTSFQTPFAHPSSKKGEGKSRKQRNTRPANSSKKFFLRGGDDDNS